MGPTTDRDCRAGPTMERVLQRNGFFNGMTLNYDVPLKPVPCHDTLRRPDADQISDRSGGASFNATETNLKLCSNILKCCSNRHSLSAFTFIGTSLLYASHVIDVITQSPTLRSLSPEDEGPRNSGQGFVWRGQEATK